MTDARPPSSELRERIIRDQVLPMAEVAFEREPRAASVLFVVAQYWNDEADDAVHGELLACIDADPRWPDCARYAANPIGKLDAADAYDAADDYIPTDDAFTAQLHLFDDVPPSVRFFDDNGEMIVAFAAFCLEGCDQEQPMNESYTPYCIVRRGVAEPEVVGRMLRPEWEDRWDVLDAGGSLAAAMSPTPDVSASASASARTPPKSATLAAGLLVVLATAWVLWSVVGR